MRAWSIRSLPIAVLLAGLVGLATAQPSPVLELEIQGHPGIFSRANHTGKYAGSQCDTNDDCYSKNCQNYDGTKKCYRQAPGGPCFENGNCITRNCNRSTGTCTGPSKFNGDCFNTPCVSTLTCDEGLSKICKVKVGYKCKKKSDCASGAPCTNGICTLALGPNRPCNDASECISNSCSIDNACVKDDGTDDTCEDITQYASSGVCGRYNLGHTCVHPGDCLQGQCKGTCVNSTVGDTCVEPYQCTNGQVCNSGQCAIISDASQHPGDACSTDAQCISKECSTSWQQGYNGIWSYYGPARRASSLDERQIASCAPIKNGDSGCRDYGDCETGLCQNGVCKAGSTGDRCIASDQCGGDLVCSLDGVCGTPTEKSGKYGVCKTDAQCYSGSCDINYTFQRPSINGIGGAAIINVDDHGCQASGLGDGCAASSDCDEGQCNSDGKCAGRPLGAACDDPRQCQSLSCTPPEGSTSSVCSIAAKYAACSSDSQCYSNNCGTGSCGYLPLSCPTNHCIAVPEGGQCRTDRDCSDYQGCMDGTCQPYGR